MHFSTFCDNKGCHKEMEPVVDKDTLEAFCTACNKEIKSINIFMRRQMAAHGMVKKSFSKKQPWSVICQECQKEAPPKPVDGKFYCYHCDKEMTSLSKPFLELYKQNLKNIK